MNLFIKLFLLVIAFTTSLENLLSQTAVNFYYDASGNRIQRNVISLKSGKINPPVFNVADSASFKPEIFQETQGETAIKILPNPTRGELKIILEGYETVPTSGIYLYDLTGSLKISKSPANASFMLDLSNYPMGTYILKIVLGDKTSEWKILKE